MSDNDSSVLSEELFNKLYAYRYQYEEYNMSEPNILKKLFHNLINIENLSRINARNLLKEFYLFNTFQITQSEIEDILDSLMNIRFNYPSSVQNLVNRFPILVAIRLPF